MSEENKESIMSKLGGEDGSFLKMMQDTAGKEVLATIIPQLEPFIDPMLEGIGEALGDDENWVLLRKVKGVRMVCIIKAALVESFKIKEGGVHKEIHAKDFVKSMLNKDIDNLMK